MISDVEICNQALIKLGTKTIISFDDATNEARLCNIIYELSRNSVLRAHTWSFATKIEPLDQLSDNSIINWKYLYTYPSQCLFIVKIYNETDIDTNTYKLLLSPDTNQKVIATNLYQAYAEYVKKIIDPNLFDETFIEAFVYKLASEFAMAIIGQPELQVSYLKQYNYILGEAKRVNSQEKNIKVINKARYVTVRG